MNSIILLVILCGGIHLSDGAMKLNCLFNVQIFDVVGSVYTCYVTSLDNWNNNNTIDGFTGAHKVNNNYNDVKAIYLHSTNTKYIPANIGSVFKLSAFRMWRAQLIEIKTKDFHGMEKLEYLDVGVNKIKSVPSDVFITLPKLKQIYLYSNQIKELPIGLFSNNLELEGVHLDKNQIKFIDSGLFDGLTKLNNVNLDNNFCVQKGYTGTTEIIQVKKDIKLYCNIPNDSIELKLNKMMQTNSNSGREMKDLIRNELMKVKEENQIMMKQLQNVIDFKKDLFKIKEQQQLDKLEMNGIIIDKEALKMENLKLKRELSKSKENQQKNTIEMTKVVIDLNNLHKEIFELKQKHQTDKIVFSELRTKLMKANEQLAHCVID